MEEASRALKRAERDIQIKIKIKADDLEAANRKILDDSMTEAVREIENFKEEGRLEVRLRVGVRVRDRLRLRLRLRLRVRMRGDYRYMIKSSSPKPLKHFFNSLNLEQS